MVKGTSRNSFLHAQDSCDALFNLAGILQRRESVARARAEKILGGPLTRFVRATFIIRLLTVGPMIRS